MRTTRNSPARPGGSAYITAVARWFSRTAANRRLSRASRLAMSVNGLALMGLEKGGRWVDFSMAARAGPSFRRMGPACRPALAPLDFVVIHAIPAHPAVLEFFRIFFTVSGRKPSMISSLLKKCSAAATTGWSAISANRGAHQCAGERPHRPERRALGAKTAEFRQRLANGETLEQLLPEAFAVCREASRRALGMRHFDVQLIGGMVLNDGKIAEMRTGEGKTLVATLPAYLNALTGNGVHRHRQRLPGQPRCGADGALAHEFLGLRRGVNLSQMSHEAKQAAYGADITYGTNNEFGFDYLRDNMVFSLAEKVQRKLAFAVVDEVDSILIDEARTPLLISGPADDNVEMYQRMNGVPAMLTRQTEEEGSGDYWVDEKAHTVMLSEAGHERAEAILTELGLLAEGDSLYSATNITLMHHLMAALRAHALYHRDQHYVVQNDEVVIVDEFTGRLMSGRRWNEGLHQAVEAKEGVTINRENQTLASITFQNYFRLYRKLSGMTGTADTEAYEFQQIYGLETVVIPPTSR